MLFIDGPLVVLITKYEYLAKDLPLENNTHLVLLQFREILLILVHSSIS